MKITIVNIILFILLILIISYIILCSFKKRSKYGGDAEPKMKAHLDQISLTYAINGEDSGLDYTQLRKVLNAAHFKEVDKSTHNVHLSIGGFDEKSFKLKKLLYNGK